MSPASGPVNDPKIFPAAVMEDQEAIMAGEQPQTLVGPVPYSSPDPETDGIRMQLIEEDTDAYQERMKAQQATDQVQAANYGEMDLDDLKKLAEERDLEIEGTGKSGRVLKTDYVNALNSDDTKDMKAADWKEQISAAKTQEELDAVLQRYEDSEATYSSVEAAAERRQEEIDNETNNDNEQ